MINATFINKRHIKLSDRVRQVMGSSRNGQIYELGMVQAFFNKMVAIPRDKYVYLDIGANTGSYALLPIIKDNITCHAFEPNPVAYDVLKENVELNNLKNTHIHNMGFWKEDKELELKTPKDLSDSGLSTLGENPTRFKYSNKTGEYTTQKVECKKIDTIVEELKLEEVHAIKIDTEGAELFILQGGEKTLKSRKPLLLLEYDDKNTKQFGYLREDIKNLLILYGYDNFVMYGKSDIFVF